MCVNTMFVLHGQFNIVFLLIGANSFQILNSHLQQFKTNVNCAQYDSRLTIVSVIEYVV